MTCRNPKALALLWLALLATTLISACGEKEEPDPARIKEPLGISYTRVGGIAGVDQRLEITAGDEALVSFGGEALHGAGADPALVAEARDAVEALQFGRLRVPPKPTPADDFTLTLVHGSDRISGPASQLSALGPLREALDPLDEILAEAAARSNPPAGGGSGSN